jgi:hypothetical protein
MGAGARTPPAAGARMLWRSCCRPRFVEGFRPAGAGTRLAQGRIMSLLTIILVIVVVGVLLWAINSFIPMDSKIKSILNIVVVIALILWLLQAFGILGSLSSVRVG